jgi:hypothetical protein
MLERWKILFILTCAATISLAQARKTSIGDPLDTVREYLRMGADGSLLTSEGWRRANLLFVDPVPEPHKKTIYLYSKGGQPGVTKVSGDRAEAEQFSDPLGTIDPSLRYSPQAKTNAEGTIILYHLVLTDRQRELGPDGKSIKETKGPLQWKLDATHSMPWATVEAAILYLKRVRNQTTDSELRKNADATIRILLKKK